MSGLQGNLPNGGASGRVYYKMQYMATYHIGVLLLSLQAMHLERRTWQGSFTGGIWNLAPAMEPLCSFQKIAQTPKVHGPSCPLRPHI